MNVNAADGAVVPSDRVPAIVLEEEAPGKAVPVADGFWIIATRHRPGLSKRMFEINNRCLVFRLQDRDGPVLMAVNQTEPIAIPVVRELEQQTGSKVRYLVSPGGGHHLQIEPWHAAFPDALTFAEESTSWPGVSRPVAQGGLGFDLKWNMGWMHDTLSYLKQDPLYRRGSHQNLTFPLVYAFKENFLLPLSHDEVVHGKRSLLMKMPGERAQKFANLRALFGWQYASAGKKLLFMGGEIGQMREWNHDRQLDWDLLDEPDHRQLQRWVRDLNRLYVRTPALHARDFDARGFTWLDCEDANRSLVAFVRRGTTAGEFVLVIANFTPVPRPDYRVGAPVPGRYRVLLNGDAAVYGGGGKRIPASIATQPIPCHGQPQSMVVPLPPLAVLFLAIAAATPRKQKS